MTEKLKKCPICGKIEPLRVATDKEINELEKGEGWGTYAVVCARQFGGCGASSGYYETEEEAITAWNTRAADENPPLTLDELREMEGEPVWIECREDKGHWALLNRVSGTGEKRISWKTLDSSGFYNITELTFCEGKHKFYRRKPEA